MRLNCADDTALYIIIEEMTKRLSRMVWTDSRCGMEFKPSKCQLVLMAGWRTMALLNSAHELEDLCQ